MPRRTSAPLRDMVDGVAEADGRRRRSSRRARASLNQCRNGEWSITGVGVISALGHNAREFLDRVVAGTIRAFARCKRWTATCCGFQMARRFRDYDHSAYFDEKEAALLDRFAQFGVVAAREAVADAGVEMDIRSCVSARRS